MAPPEVPLVVEELLERVELEMVMVLPVLEIAPPPYKVAELFDRVELEMVIAPLLVVEL